MLLIIIIFLFNDLKRIIKDSNYVDFLQIKSFKVANSNITQKLYYKNCKTISFTAVIAAAKIIFAAVATNNF